MDSPHSLEAEKSVLAAILLDNAAFHVAFGIIGTGDFFRPAHQVIARAYERLQRAKRAIDPITLADELTRTNELETAGGPVYLHDLLAGMTRSTNVEYYATIVREKATLRKLIAHAGAMLEAAKSPAADVAEVMEAAESGLLDISRRAAPGGFVLASDWMSRVYGQIQAAQERQSIISGLPTGIPSLDRYTRGLQPSDLIIIGGRTSSGKTSLAMQMVLEATRRVMTAVVSLEMSADSLGFRVVATEAKVDSFRMLTGQLDDCEMMSVGQAIERLGERPLAVDDASGQTVAEVCSKVRRLALQHGLGAVFVDYVQLMRGHANAENRTREMADISHRLKGLAKDLKVPVVLLSQINRGSEREGNKEPQLHQLRESGDLEQDCDLCLLIHRPNQHVEDRAIRPDDVAHIRVAKQRNGPQGRVFKVRWDGPTMRFLEETEPPKQGAFLE
jgi:replicative DNA helicase